MARIICLCPRCEGVNLRFRGRLSLDLRDEENIYDFECLGCEKMFKSDEVIFHEKKEYQGRKYPYRLKKEEEEVYIKHVRSS